MKFQVFLKESFLHILIHNFKCFCKSSGKGSAFIVFCYRDLPNLKKVCVLQYFILKLLIFHTERKKNLKFFKYLVWVKVTYLCFYLFIHCVKNLQENRIKNYLFCYRERMQGKMFRVRILLIMVQLQSTIKKLDLPWVNFFIHMGL